MTPPSTPSSVLKSVFGYDSFRANQAVIIENVLSQRDTIAIMPTGGGKSLCYQIPALILPGLTVVVSPLISLMQDQIEQLQDAGVNAVVLNSSIDSETYRRNMSQVARGQAKLLYLAPETMLMPRILEFLSSITVSCIAIDEAHCISEWGHEFRPEYRQLAEVRLRFPRAVCIALTATATPRVREDIRRSLSMDNGGGRRVDEFVSSFDRPNLYLEIVPRQGGVKQLMEVVERFGGQSGIVYCASRRQVDSLTAQLQRRGIVALPYHAGLDDAERAANQERFRMDEAQVIVATVAFGMGINKPDVRFVVHYELPKNIESYYQQIGRAGRDGLDAYCLLLFSYGDIGKIQFFIEQMGKSEQQLARAHLNTLLRFCESVECRRILLLEYFGETPASDRCDACDNCRKQQLPKVDLTEAAQKFMSCVFRTGERFGLAYIADVLRGSEAQKVIDQGHHLISTFGIGKEKSKAEWLELGRLLLREKLIAQTEHGGLQLCQRARPVLAGREAFVCRISPLVSRQDNGAAKKDSGAKKRSHSDRSIQNKPLFEKLRALRTRLAKTRGVPPYVVFSDRTLIAMANQRPQSLHALLAIPGVGDAKLQKYGNSFLAVLKGA